MADKWVKFDDQARIKLNELFSEFNGVRNIIINNTVNLKNVSTSPNSLNWGGSNPVDIRGIIEKAFVEGIRYANDNFNSI